MKSRIETIQTKLLVGISGKMSYTNDNTVALWQSFMPQRKHIQNRVDSLYYSMQIYPTLFNYAEFDPSAPFIKWAAVEVKNIDKLPEEMESYVLEGGTYVVFTHIGPASTFPKSMHYIHEVWFPDSEYTIDDRPHFEILEEGYDPFDEHATEEIWIPVKRKV